MVVVQTGSADGNLASASREHRAHRSSTTDTGTTKWIFLASSMGASEMPMALTLPSSTSSCSELTAQADNAVHIVQGLYQDYLRNSRSWLVGRSHQSAMHELLWNPGACWAWAMLFLTKLGPKELNGTCWLLSKSAATGRDCMEEGLGQVVASAHLHCLGSVLDGGSIDVRPHA